MTLEELKHDAKVAIHDFEHARSARLLKELKKYGGTESDEEVRFMRALLSIVGFPSISDEEAAELVQNRVLMFYYMGFSFEDLLMTRYMFSGESDKNKQREMIREALLKNQETIGSITVADWLRRFDQEENPETREEVGVHNFLSRSNEADKLSPNLRELLRSFLITYERLIATEIISEDDITGYHWAIDHKDRAPRNSSHQPESHMGGVGPSGYVRLPLLQALSKYEQLGNQLITQERIRIKSQQEPVRPSLLYWIKYYRDELGIGHHNSVERGNFLFRSENGQHLSAEERERVNLVLKSIEENYPLEIDTQRSEIVFPSFEPPRVASPRPIPAAPIFTPAPPTFTPIAPAAPTVPQPTRPNPTFQFGQGNVMGASGMSRQAPAGALSFTSKHVFPAEKIAVAPEPPVPPVPTAPAPTAPRAVPKAPSKGNPFHIHPVSLGDQQDE